jgi:DNA-binding transcriptional LysR family regulator
VFHLVTSNETDALYRDLQERKVDVLIARKGGHLSDEKFRFEFLYDPSFVVVAGSRSPWARRRRIALAELVNEAWVLPPPEGLMGPAFQDVLRAGGLGGARITVYATPEVRLNLAATGRFLTIATNLIFGLSKRPGIKVLPVKLRYTSLPMGIVTLKNRTISPVARLFIETARDVAKPLARRK